MTRLTSSEARIAKPMSRALGRRYEQVVAAGRQPRSSKAQQEAARGGAARAVALGDIGDPQASAPCRSRRLDDRKLPRQRSREVFKAFDFAGGSRPTSGLDEDNRTDYIHPGMPLQRFLAVT